MCSTEGAVAPIAVRVQMSNSDLQVATYRVSDTNKSTQPSLWPLPCQERALVQANRLQRERRSGHQSNPLWPRGPRQAAAALTARSLSSMGIRQFPITPVCCIRNYAHLSVRRSFSCSDSKLGYEGPVDWSVASQVWGPCLLVWIGRSNEIINDKKESQKNPKGRRIRYNGAGVTHCWKAKVLWKLCSAD